MSARKSATLLAQFAALLLAAVLLLAACSQPKLATPEEDQRARTMAVPEGKALIYLIARGVQTGFELEFCVSEECLGESFGGTYQVVQTDPGPVRIEMEMRNGVWRNDDRKVRLAVQLPVEPGHRYYVRQEIQTSLHPGTAVTVLFGGIMMNQKHVLKQLNEAEAAETMTTVRLHRIVTIAAKSAADPQAWTMDVPQGKALIYLFRTESASWEMRQDVQVNQRVAGTMGAHSFLLVEVSPGLATLQLGGLHGDSLSIDALAGQRYYLRLRSNFSLQEVNVADWDDAKPNLRLVGHVKF